MRDLQPYKDLVTPFGRFLRWTGCVRYYRDGDGANAIFRWWHPVSWIVWIVALQICGFVGERVMDQVPFRLQGSWANRPDEIEWL